MYKEACWVKMVKSESLSRIFKAFVTFSIVLRLLKLKLSALHFRLKIYQNSTEIINFCHKYLRSLRKFLKGFYNGCT